MKRLSNFIWSDRGAEFGMWATFVCMFVILVLAYVFQWDDVGRIGGYFALWLIEFVLWVACEWLGRKTNGNGQGPCANVLEQRGSDDAWPHIHK